MLIPPLERVERHHVLVLPIDQRVAAPRVTARLRGRRNDRARRVLILGLEVLGDDTVLLHGASREWITAAGVLASDAARCEVVLQARAVDEQVDLICRLTSCRDRLGVHAIDTIFGDRDARRESGEVEEIPPRRRQLLDLLRRDVRRHL